MCDNISVNSFLEQSFSEKNCEDNQNIHFLFRLSPINRPLYEIMCKNTVQPDGPQMIIQ
jgi:hypothetical protein